MSKESFLVEKALVTLISDVFLDKPIQCGVNITGVQEHGIVTLTIYSGFDIDHGMLTPQFPYKLKSMEIYWPDEKKGTRIDSELRLSEMRICHDTNYEITLVYIISIYV